MRIKLGLALVAALVFSVGITTASASASLAFLSSVSKAKLLSEKVKTQIFTTEEGTVECTEAKIEKGETGTAGAEELSQLAEIKYGGCLAFGIVPTEISNADYLFLPSGLVHIDNLIRILASIGGCEVSVPQQLNELVHYATTGNNIKLEPEVSGILYTANSACTKPGEFKTGTYKGTSEAMISGGTLSFMP